jgi:hypothetical protein
VGDVFSPHQPPSDRQVFRSAGAVVLWWAWLVFAAASLVALAVDGRDHSSVVTAILLVAVTGVMYACAWWPRIVADENGISVLNPLRGHMVPWAAVAKVDLVNAVRVHTAPAPGAARGKIIYSWAVQSSARARLKRESAARRSSQSRLPQSRLPQSRSSQSRLPQSRSRQSPLPDSRSPYNEAAPSPYGKLPPQAQEAMERSPAEFVAQQLAERAARERAALSPAEGQPASPSGHAAVSPAEGQPASPSGHAAVSPAEGQPASPSGTSVARASWTWAPIAAMVLPVLALIIVVLT